MRIVRTLCLLASLVLPYSALAEGVPGPSAPYSIFSKSAIVVSDTLIKTGPGFLQCIMFAQSDAAPTAGTISILDSTSAGAGTAIFTHVFTTAVFLPVQICPQTPFTTGLYIDMTTVGDINTTVSYR